MKTSSAKCPVCDKVVSANKAQANHLVHAIVTLFSFGAWIIVWIFASINAANSPWRCQYCGTVVHPHS
ncbi:MAG: hypothetical protein KF784_11580 [Fimbriimonadaceae bacterium]|nr:hypothetical protein [Fimbriimonadaceae bacterium]